MNKTTNLKVRNAIKDSGLYQWEVADLLGVADVTFCRWLRKELPEEEQERIVQAIKSGRK